MSTEHGIVWLTSVEARQLALDLNRASGPGEPRRGLTWLGVVLGGLARLIFTATLLAVALVLYGIGLLFGLAWFPRPGAVAKAR